MANSIWTALTRRAGVDVVLHVKGEKGEDADPRRELWITKARDGEEKMVCAFQLEQRCLGKTTKGRDITTAIIAYIEAQRAKPKPNLSPTQQGIAQEFDHLVLAGRSEVSKGHDASRTERTL